MFPMMVCAIDGPEDHDLIVEFYTQNKMLLYAEAWKYLSTKEDVEDIVCETFARLIAYMDKFRTLLPHERIQYAKAVVRNLSYIHLRRSTFFTMVPFEDVDVYLTVEENQLPESIAFKHLRLDAIRKIWAQIPVEDRLLLEQKYILDWSDKDLSARLGIQPQSVRMMLTRTRRKVAALMKAQGFDISDWL